MKKDKFDEFFKTEILKSEININDDGFSDLVIKNLPKRKYNYLNRNIIILVSTFMSFIVFTLVNGVNQFIKGIFSFLDSLLNHGSLNYEFIIVIVAFSFLFLSIPTVEFKRRSL